jgi:hypothetical protein
MLDGRLRDAGLSNVLSCEIVDDGGKTVRASARITHRRSPHQQARRGPRFATLTPVAKNIHNRKSGLLMASADPDSSAFAMVWTHTSRLSPLGYEGKAATICQECRLVESAFLILGNRSRGRNRLVSATGVGKDSALSHNASCDRTW